MCKASRVADKYFGERLTERMDVAVLIKMLPKDLHEMVYRMRKVGEGVKYQEVRDKVVAVAVYKANVRVPLPREEGGTHEVENWSWGGMELGEADNCFEGEATAFGKGSAGRSATDVVDSDILHASAVSMMDR